MVKTLFPAHEMEIVRRAVPILDSLLGRIPGIRFQSNIETLDSNDRPFMADLKYTVTHTTGETWTLVAQVKQNAEPRLVRLAAYQIADYSNRIPGHRDYPLFVAPYISKESARICEEAGLGYVDLAGNARLAFGSIYISEQGHPNPFPDRRDKSMFALKASRVLRIMLDAPQRWWKTIQLAEETGVSTGQISNVRSALMAQDWAEETPKGFRITKPHDVLRKWAREYKGQTAQTQLTYTLRHGADLDHAIRDAIHEVGHQHLLLASFSAAKWTSPYARTATQFLYADERGEAALSGALGLVPVSGGENVVVIRPKDKGVFDKPLDAGQGMWCTNPIQTYLDLYLGGERGEEAADFLLNNFIVRRWQVQQEHERQSHD